MEKLLTSTVNALDADEQYKSWLLMLGCFATVVIAVSASCAAFLPA